jgi:hypothetical protein
LLKIAGQFIVDNQENKSFPIHSSYIQLSIPCIP